LRLILSRKGFDSENGGVASPILPPDDTLLSLPITEERKESAIRYGDLNCCGINVGRIVSDLTKGGVRADARAHLDPDLNRDLYHPRSAGWRPVFGQVDAAQSHLRRHGVTIGDLFLFFGWFRRVELYENDRYRFARNAPDLHVIYGWLQVGEIVPVNDAHSRAPEWVVGYHPHFCGERSDNNTVYISSEKLTIPGVKRDIPGGGTFRRFHPDLQLTAQWSRSRSLWRLPRWFYPMEHRRPLSYHSNPKSKRWMLCDDCAILRSASRGQEFVLDVVQYPEAVAWINKLMTQAF
jgi:hypothetical protein